MNQHWGSKYLNLLAWVLRREQLENQLVYSHLEERLTACGFGVSEVSPVSPVVEVKFANSSPATA
jgi:hypothetical protein